MNISVVIALDLIADPALFADVAGVPLIKHILDGGHLALTLGGVNGVRDGHQPDVMLREERVHELADLDVITTEPGKVFYKDSLSVSFLQLGHHGLEAGPVHGDARNAVVRKDFQV